MMILVVREGGNCDKCWFTYVLVLVGYRMAADGTDTFREHVETGSEGRRY
jgi:hypothetical protein